ncbi:MAG: hypothetical protein J5732_00590 [Bacteroidaceae bacterium]|nr:hypothetical protein [Bacteroidaceae bacterium]
MIRVSDRLRKVVREASPRAFRTIWWIFKITAAVSFAMFLLRWSGMLNWIAVAVSPVFNLFGLPGEASMAYVSGYFINVYSCIAVVSTLELTTREITILGTMTLAAHAMVVECAVQHKTGTPTAYVAVLRTLASLSLGVLLNLVLPGRPDLTGASDVALSEIPFFEIQGEFLPQFKMWFIGLARLAVWMTCLIYLLNILQSILYEYGVMSKIALFFRPLLSLFGLDGSTAFLWIVANLVGLSYGSAAIMDEMHRGNVKLWDINLLNTHIGVSHSNLEDLFLFSAIGGLWYVMLLARWIMVTVLVWTVRLVKPRYLLG